MDVREHTKKLANDIRTKVYGKEVREALATGIEESGDTSQEARDITENLLDGSYDTGLLNTEIEQRMNNLYSTKGQAMDDLYTQKNTDLTDLYINEKSELDNLQVDYANRAEVLETTYAPRLTDTESELLDARNGESDLKTRIDKDKQEITAQLAQTPTKDETGWATLNIYTEEERAKLLGLEPGEINAVLGPRNVKSENIGLKEVTVNEIDEELNVINVLNINDLTPERYPGGSTGDAPVIVSGSNWWGLIDFNNPIAVKSGDVVRFNRAFQNTYFIGVDKEGLIRQRGANKSSAGYAEVVVEDSVVGFYTAVYKDYLSEAMITINNEMPSVYIPFPTKKKLGWLNVGMDNLEDDVIYKINNNENNHKYIDSNGVITGDSIVWNVGRNPTGKEVLIGYDGVLNRELGLDLIENFGYSGRPLSSGSANGNGIYDNLIAENIDWGIKDWLINNAGTNDFKLNMPIGEIQPFGSDFNTDTYIGAYQALIEYVKEQNPDVEIITLTPAQRKNAGYTTESTNTAGHKLIDYVNAVKEVAQKYSTMLVDVYSESGITEFTINQDTYDGLHLNNNGYEKAGMLVVKKMIYS